MSQHDNRLGVLTRLGRLCRRWRRDDRGVAAIEFALIAPIMMVLLFGVWEYSRIVSADRRVTKIAGSVANLVALATSPNNTSEAQITCNGVADILEVMDVLLSPYDPATMRVSIFNIRTKSDSATDVEVKWSAWKGSKLTPPLNYVSNGKLLVDKKDDEVIVVIAEYDYPFLLDAFISRGWSERGQKLSTFRLAETEPMKPRVGTITLTSTAGKNDVSCQNGG
jgi:Flp pilus assembly pilin Flp